MGVLPRHVSQLVGATSSCSPVEIILVYFHCRKALTPFCNCNGVPADIQHLSRVKKMLVLLTTSLAFPEWHSRVRTRPHTKSRCLTSPCSATSGQMPLTPLLKLNHTIAMFS